MSALERQIVPAEEDGEQHEQEGEEQQVAVVEEENQDEAESSSNSSSSTFDGSDNEDNSDDGEAVFSRNLPPMSQLHLPEPRKHAYLPGASHPLYPEEWIGVRGGGNSGHQQNGSPRLSASCRRLNLSHDDDNNNTANAYDPIPPTIPPPNSIITELPILELDDVILFPGCTVPLRLRHPGWVEYLGTRIDEARLGLGHSRPNSGNTEAADAADVTARGDQVRIGVLMRMRETRRRNRAGGQRPRPPTIHPVGDQGGGTAAGAARGGRRGRWRTELLRRGIRRAREAEQETAEGAAGDDAARRDDQARQGEDEELQGGRRPPSPPRQPAVPATPPDPLVGRIGTVAIITYTHEIAADSGDNGDNSDDHPPPNASYQSRVWLRHSGQLIMTALGTSRFRILSRIDSATWDAEHRVHPELHRGDMADIKLYAVEILIDENIPLPPVSVRRGIVNCAKIIKDNNSEMGEAAEGTNNVSEAIVPDGDEAEGRHDEEECNEQICKDVVEQLSRCAPLPAFAYNVTWPWRLVQQICTELSEIPAWEGLRNSLPISSGIVNSADNDSATVFQSNMSDPLAFSFWMAANLPLPAYDRLDLLEMDCLVQRLRYIFSKVAQQRQLEKPIRCKQCSETISSISSMFTVGGAEGTTGAYVNEYGIVHQTITVRRCSSRSVFFVGSRETRDSWFPGYTWKIMHCAVCHQHLGWRFDLLRQFREPQQQADNNVEGGSPRQQQQRRHSENLDRPERFFGLAGGSVTTEDSHAPRRMAAADLRVMEARHPLLMLQQALMQGRQDDEEEEE